VQQVDGAAHRRDDEAGKRPRRRRQQNDAGFPGTDEGAQPVWRLELGERLAQVAPLESPFATSYYHSDTKCMHAVRVTPSP
jgi:hypothetical protein